jgi:hypothetical protein
VLYIFGISSGDKRIYSTSMFLGLAIQYPLWLTMLVQEITDEDRNWTPNADVYSLGSKLKSFMRVEASTKSVYRNDAKAYLSNSYQHLDSGYRAMYAH